MSLNFIIEKFQNYTFNENSYISEYLNNLRNAGNLKENDLGIQEYLLPEILALAEKAILNRMSADLLFTSNYWSWGFVSVYYSNFFLAQALNRLKGNFYTRVGKMKMISYQSNDNKYMLLNESGRDSHKLEFTKLRENYLFLLESDKFRDSVPDDYSSQPYYNESEVRNNINYGLKHYKEFNGNFTDDITIEECVSNYKNSTFNTDEFRLLKKSTSRMKLLFYLLTEINKINSNVDYPDLFNKIKQNSEYIFKNSILRCVERNITIDKQFHCISIELENQFKGLLDEI